MEYTVSKIDAAVDQLDWSIKLFLDHQAYVSAITLAGAAEEIVGQVLGEKAVFNQLKKTFAERFGLPEKLVSQSYLNKTKNWLKHWQALQDDEALSIALEDEAVQYIVRGLTNLVLHDRSLPSEGLRFFAWLSQNSERLGLNAFSLPDREDVLPSANRCSCRTLD